MRPLNLGELAILGLGIGTTVYIATRPSGFEKPKPKPSGGEIPPPDPGGRELDSFGVPFGRSSSDPLWPLADDRRSRPEKTAKGRYAWARGRVTADFGDPRPYGDPTPTRHHVGEDLVAPHGAIVVATERGEVTSIDDDWYHGTGALLVYFEGGITANFGEVEPGSALDAGLAVGTVVERGQPIGRVGRTDQLHFELYNGRLRRTHQWPWLGAAPAELLDPTRYLELAAKTVPA